MVGFKTADDCKTVGYLTDENSFYLWTKGGDKVKVASDISSIEHVSKDLSTIYFIKDDSLYKKSADSEDKEKITSDISNVIKIYDSGEIYYTKEEASEINLIDYVDDDMAEADANLTKPEFPEYPDSPDYPYWRDYGTDEEYEAAKTQYKNDYEVYKAACDQIRADYNSAYEAYRAKLNRDSLREDLQNATVESTKYTLYYFNGTEETVVTDALVDGYSATCAADKPLMLVDIYNQSEVQKVKLSEISSSYEIESMVNAAFYSSSEKYIVIDSVLSIIDQTEGQIFKVAADGSAIYFLDDIFKDENEDGDIEYGDLYKITITENQASDPELYDSDVLNAVIYFKDNKLIYFKNGSNNKGDLYIDKEEVDYDVSWDRALYIDEVILYYTDWNNEKGGGTLKMFKDGAKTKIADDVYNYTITKDGDILYLYDYSYNYYTGTLYLYNKGESRKIDDDVNALIIVYEEEDREEQYYANVW
ncbi:hypothetical protein [Lachnoclostridium edouardi]|uniref:hypothetical protein n=1 Tax=Lachnoclostridium edouardi TaxID=1926283 RepID=UPI0011AEEBD0|nr:hypothetical protein [Lachnoclostridium edouardi]